MLNNTLNPAAWALLIRPANSLGLLPSPHLCWNLTQVMPAEAMRAGLLNVCVCPPNSKPPTTTGGAETGGGGPEAGGPEAGGGAGVAAADSVVIAGASATLLQRAVLLKPQTLFRYPYWSVPGTGSPGLPGLLPALLPVPHQDLNAPR